jgi:hypothetical protein
VEIRWAAGADNVGVTGYKVLRDGAALASVGASVLSYTDSSAAAGTTYRYAVQAFDAAGNHSAPGTPVSVTTPAAPAPSGCTPAINAFTGCYYPNIELSGNPVLIRTDNQIDFNWMYTSPDKSLPERNYSVRWQGSFTFEAGDYTFSATTSDGMRIYIDGSLILDRWRDQPEYSYTIRRLLPAGTHLVTVEYYQRTGAPRARVSWKKN